MRAAALYLVCGWLVLVGRAYGQDAAHADEVPGLAHTAAGHGPGRELTAEDVPDHEPEHPTRWRIRSEYVLWLMKKANTPPLLSTSLNTAPRPGVLGTPSARTIYGGDIDLNERHGGMFTLGYSFDDEDCLALEMIYGFAGERKAGILTSSLGSTPAFPVLARPFFDVVTGREDASLIAFPGLVAGSVDIKYGTYFDTGELNLSRHLCGEKENRLHLLGGLRVARFEETLSILEIDNVQPTAATIFAGRTINVRDLFETDNTFYGAQLGLRGVFHRKRWEMEGILKVGLGVMDREIRRSGATSINTIPPTSSAAGLLVLASNRGQFDSSAFSVLPEASLRAGYRITENLQVFFGYSFLFMSEVLRPGDQIDRNLNPNLIPTSATFGAAVGPARPAPLEVSSDFWVHGLRFGVELKF